MSPVLFLRLIRHATTRKERQPGSVGAMWFVGELRRSMERRP